MRGPRPEENWLSLFPAAINCLAVPFLIQAGLLLLVMREQTTTAAVNWWVEQLCHIQKTLCAWPSLSHGWSSLSSLLQWWARAFPCLFCPSTGCEPPCQTLYCKRKRLWWGVRSVLMGDSMDGCLEDSLQFWFPQWVLKKKRRRRYEIGAESRGRRGKMEDGRTNG